jgi:hypothetical protein
MTSADLIMAYGMIALAAFVLGSWVGRNLP